MGYSVLVVAIFLVRIWKLAVSTKKYCQKNFVELKSLLPLQPVSEKRLFRGRKKPGTKRAHKKKFGKNLQSKKKFLPLQPVSPKPERSPLTYWRQAANLQGLEKKSVKFLWQSERGQTGKIKTLYNEEFDPGSGWTLAAGLTHASRGASRCSNTLAATGGRVRNAWATCPSQGDNPWKRGLTPHRL